MADLLECSLGGSLSLCNVSYKDSSPQMAQSVGTATSEKNPGCPNQSFQNNGGQCTLLGASFVFLHFYTDLI